MSETLSCVLPLPASPAVDHMYGASDVASRAQLAEALGPERRLPEAFWFLRDVVRVRACRRSLQRRPGVYCILLPLLALCRRLWASLWGVCATPPARARW